MLQIIRKGDKTTHGGSVMTASETMKFGGLGVARKGDMVSCPITVPFLWKNCYDRWRYRHREGRFLRHRNNRLKPG